MGRRASLQNFLKGRGCGLARGPLSASGRAADRAKKSFLGLEELSNIVRAQAPELVDAGAGSTECMGSKDTIE